MLSVKPMENTAHFAYSVCGINHNNLGRAEAAARLKLPTEAVGINTH